MPCFALNLSLHSSRCRCVRNSPGRWNSAGRRPHRARRCCHGRGGRCRGRGRHGRAVVRRLGEVRCCRGHGGRCRGRLGAAAGLLAALLLAGEAEVAELALDSVAAALGVHEGARLAHAPQMTCRAHGRNFRRPERRRRRRRAEHGAAELGAEVGRGNGRGHHVGRRRDQLRLLELPDCINVRGRVRRRRDEHDRFFNLRLLPLGASVQDRHTHRRRQGPETEGAVGALCPPVRGHPPALPEARRREVEARRAQGRRPERGIAACGQELQARRRSHRAA
mmetsp:Transcript_50880/g.164691  ORF Transcript_50880/g.164691 Transcript_50880/m.164691 type:complete len:279 (-) Transcript_50880:478-1314(-)